MQPAGVSGAGPWYPPSESSGTHQQGVTLLELVLVIVLIGMAMALSYPALTRGSASIRLRAAGRDIVNTMRYAREKAITEQKEMRVLADRENQRIILSDELGEGSRSFGLTREVKISRFALAGGEILEGPLVVRFLPNGSAETSEILLRSDTGGFVRVVTDPITGGARLLLGSGESFR